MPEISIIVPVYRVEAYLARCVDSILAQTYPDFELILVDDGSPDGCPAICDAYRAKDPRVRVIHQPNGGLSAARNAGLDRVFAHGDSRYITFIDSDDWVHPRYLELLLCAINDTDCPVAIGGHARVSDDIDPEVAEQPSISVIDPEVLYHSCIEDFIVAWGKLFRREDLERLRFPVGRIHEDEFTIWRILLRYDRAAIVEAPLYAYRQRGDSITGSPWTPARLDVLDALEEQGAWAETNGRQALKKEIVRRSIYVCMGQLHRLRTAGASGKLRAACRQRLRGYVREAGGPLRFRRNRGLLMEAWPICARILLFPVRVLGKLRRCLRRSVGKA